MFEGWGFVLELQANTLWMEVVNCIYCIVLNYITYTYVSENEGLIIRQVHHFCGTSKSVNIFVVNK